MCEIGDGTWAVNGFSPLRKGDISHGTVMYSSRLGAHALRRRRLAAGRAGRLEHVAAHAVRAGARSGLVPSAVLVHFAERTSIDCVKEAPPEPDDATALADLRATPGAWLLTVAL